MRISTGARRALAALAASAVIVTGTLFSSTAAHAAVVPDSSVTSMAALGDSISQGTMSCGSLTCPANSWSTGTSTTVASHLLRLRATAAPDNLAGYNYSVVGANSSALNAQAVKAVTQGVRYATIEIGANDACTKTVSGMTTTDAFRTNVANALATLTADGSGRQIFVASIPNLQRMYDVNKGSSTARFTWSILQICQSMLANPSSTRAADVQRRLDVQQRVNDYNAILKTLCEGTANCRYDGGAVANYLFTKADISTRDYFHPSVTGQATLARITWATTQWVV